MGSFAMIPGRDGNLYPVNIQQREFPPNEFNRCLDQESQLWDRIIGVGGMEKVCKGQRYPEPPWITMPGQGKKFGHPSSIALPNADGQDHVVQSFIVPLGYDGVIVAPIHTYTGNGFLDGTGQLFWRIKLNQRFVKDYGNMDTRLGSVFQPWYESGAQILLQSGMLVEYLVNYSASHAGELAGGRVIAGVWGWFWPR